MRKLTILVASAAVALTLLGETSAPVEARGGSGHGGGHHGGHGGLGWGGLAAGALLYPSYGYNDDSYYGGYSGYGPYSGRRHVYYGHGRGHHGHHGHHNR